MKNLQAIDDDKARATLWEDPLCKSVVGENAPVACCLPTAPLISISFYGGAGPCDLTSEGSDLRGAAVWTLAQIGSTTLSLLYNAPCGEALEVWRPHG